MSKSSRVFPPWACNSCSTSRKPWSRMAWSSCRLGVTCLTQSGVKIFHSRDGAVDLNINVALVQHGQVGVIWETQRLSKTNPELQGGGGRSNNLLVTLVSLSRRFGFALSFRFGMPNNLEKMSFQGSQKHKHLWSGAHDSNSLAKFPTVALTCGG
jgi:hypothetical protein